MKTTAATTAYIRLQLMAGNRFESHIEPQGQHGADSNASLSSIQFLRISAESGYLSYFLPQAPHRGMDDKQLSRDGRMLNIVVPMAGLGSRFARAGYAVPKPLIPIRGVPMIRLVIANIAPSTPHRFIFICLHTHAAEFGLRQQLTAWSPGAEVVELDSLTEGAACTVLTARAHIDSDHPLMIANSDQYVDIAIDPYVDTMAARGLDGLIMTMQAHDPKWSFVALDGSGHVTQVVEKQAISTHATVGIYNFHRGADFVRAADRMIARDLRVNNEFYVAPVYNQLIEEGARIGVHDIGADGTSMHGLGIPADLDTFLALPLAERVTESLR